MKYQIASNGSLSFPNEGDAIWGYVTSEEKAIRLCELLNKKSNDKDGYYYFKDDSPVRYWDINLDYMIDRSDNLCM